MASSAHLPGGAPERELWRRWRELDDEAARAALADLHLPYAKVVAATYYARRCSEEIEFGDYLQWARLGLLESMQRFDPAKGAQFRTFAAHRIQGAILDGIERQTEVQQQLSARKRMLKDRVRSVGEGLGAHEGERRPDADARLLNLVAEAGMAFAISWLLDQTGMVQTEGVIESMPFYKSAEIAQLRARLHQLVNELPDHERRVVRGHYFHQRLFEDIAVELGLSKGRVSQIHGQALGRLRGKVAFDGLFSGTG